MAPWLIVLIAAIILVICWFWYDSLSWNQSAVPVGIVAGIVIVVGGFALWSDYDQVEERTILVEGKDRGGEDGSYRVYTDGDTLAVKDVYFDNEFRRGNSADVFGDIPVCHRLVVKTRGWEFGLFLSLMPNIVEIVEDLGLDEDCAAERGLTVPADS